MTDDSRPARRGGGPLGEDADATARVVQHTEVTTSPKVPVQVPPAEAEKPAQPPGAVHQHDPASAHQHPVSPTYPQDAQPYGAPAVATPPATPDLTLGPTAAASPNGVTSGTPPTSGYGPFHNSGDEPSEANPTGINPPAEGPTGGGPTIGAMPAAIAGPPPTDGAAAAYTETRAPAVDPAYGGARAPAVDPAYGGARAPAVDPAYGAAPVPAVDPAYGGTATSGTGPSTGPPNWSPADPTSGTTPTVDPYGFSVVPSYASGPRIEPTPKQPKGRFLLPALAGLLAGLLIFGTGGWFLGRSTGSDPNAIPAPSVTLAPSAGALPPYEQNQVAINQPKFTGSLAPVAQGWLPRLSGCSRSGDAEGPVLGKGEKTKVRCELDAMNLIFVEYATIADRDKARVKTLGQNVDARTLAPGVGAAVERATPSGRTTGNYVEYAYQASGRTVSGIWWDDSATPVAAYLLAFWREGAGRKWEPMRDVWARYA